MRIVCPSCSTAYTVADDKIGAAGRKVRCARCATRWLVEPPVAEAADAEAAMAAVAEPDTMEPVPEATAEVAVVAPAVTAAETAATAEGDAFAFASEFAGLDAPAMADEPPPPARSVAAETPGPARPPVEPAVRPRIVAQQRPRPSRLNQVRQALWRVRSFLFRSRITIGMAVFLTALILPGIGVMLRVPIVRAYPKVASLFTEIGLPVNLTGLEFRNLNTLRELENGQPVLVVEGAVGNLTLSSQPMPGLRLALRSADGQEIYAWSVEPKTATVPAGDEVRFRSRLAAPPEEAVDIQLRFTEPKTRHAVLP